MIILALLLVGIVLLVWPSLKNWRIQSEMNVQIQKINDLKEANTSDAEQTNALGAAWKYLSLYNQEVRDGKAARINDPWGFNTSAPDFPSVELADGLVGEIKIPVMDVDLPLYLGSTVENMAKGSTVVYGTSAPLGQTDSNCVVAAHRGFEDGYMFNYIERLKVGDHVYVTTPWATLDYQVTSFKVVTPDDADAIGVQVGRDMLTLLTCHPHPQHSYRLLVYCERTGTTSSSALTGSTQMTVPTTSEEITIAGMDLLDFQALTTQVGLVAGLILSVTFIVKIVRSLSKG
jgi:sortase A